MTISQSIIKVKLSHIIVSFIGIVLLFVSCDRKKVYDEYAHTPLVGWEKNDTISFAVPKVKDAGAYNFTLNLRSDNSFPFTNVVLVVGITTFPSIDTYVDTLKCMLTNKRGNTLGKGINIYQHDFSITSLNLKADDSVYVTVQHIMKREMLPGISDVGLLITKKEGGYSY